MTDHDDILEVCTRMAWYADQRNWQALGSVFAPMVTLDYTSLYGGDPVTLTPDEIVVAWSQALGGFDATQHLVTNQLVTIHSTDAVCTAAFQATHRDGNFESTLGRP